MKFLSKWAWVLKSIGLMHILRALFSIKLRSFCLLFRIEFMLVFILSCRKLSNEGIPFLLGKIYYFVVCINGRVTRSFWPTEQMFVDWDSTMTIIVQKHSGNDTIKFSWQTKAYFVTLLKLDVLKDVYLWYYL